MTAHDPLLIHDWMTDAACAEIGGDVWFADTSHDAETRKAKAICSDCPVSAQCLELALANHEPYGIWGGLGPVERARLARGAA